MSICYKLLTRTVYSLFQEPVEQPPLGFSFAEEINYFCGCIVSVKFYTLLVALLAGDYCILINKVLYVKPLVPLLQEVCK